MKSKSILFILFLAVLFFNCKHEAISTFDAGDYEIYLLFEHDGCKMYRFRDFGSDIYWSDCRGQVMEKHEETSGDEINTTQTTMKTQTTMTTQTITTK